MSDLTIKKIICDQCNTDLIVNTSYPAVYALELRAIDVNKNMTGLVYSVAVRPPIDGTKHFCNQECLRSWMEKKK